MSFQNKFVNPKIDDLIEKLFGSKKFSFLFTFVYVSPTSNKRRLVWEYLKHLQCIVSSPRILGDDFNVIRFVEECRGGSQAQENLWFQRSRSTWLSDGDHNASFYNKATMVHKHCKLITNLKLNTGEFCIDPTNMCKMATNFYEKLFTRESDPVDSCVANWLSPLGGWDYSCFKQVLLIVILHQIATIPPPKAALGTDQPCWRWEHNQLFTTRSTYAFMGSFFVSSSEVWKMIWTLSVPQCIRTFLLLAAHRKLLTNQECLTIWVQVINRRKLDDFNGLPLHKLFTFLLSKPDDYITDGEDKASRSSGCCPVLFTELWGVNDALKHAWSLGHRRLIIETNNVEVIEQHNGNFGSLHSDTIVSTLQHMLDPDWEVWIGKIKRDYNRLADALARASRGASMSEIIYNSVPRVVYDFIQEGF
ncbi:hypothetical protein GQ457_02G027260 [Hibiscus cannabinus]